MKVVFSLLFEPNALLNTYEYLRCNSDTFWYKCTVFREHNKNVNWEADKIDENYGHPFTSFQTTTHRLTVQDTILHYLSISYCSLHGCPMEVLPNLWWLFSDLL